jgi:gluconate 2-dehydrogenase gamma chain
MTGLVDRREALKKVAALMGGAISAPALLGLLNGCEARKENATWAPKFLAKDHAPVIEAVADIFIPRTDTPGAKETGVPAFIDIMLKDVYPQEDQVRFVSGLTSFADVNGRSFVELDPKEQVAHVRQIHDAAIAAKRSAGTEKLPFILMAKELTLLGFFTSEIGATQVLQHVGVPGALRECIPLAEAGNGKAWAE